MWGHRGLTAAAIPSAFDNKPFVLTKNLPKIEKMMKNLEKKKSLKNQVSGVSKENEKQNSTGIQNAHDGGDLAELLFFPQSLAAEMCAIV